MGEKANPSRPSPPEAERVQLLACSLQQEIAGELVRAEYIEHRIGKKQFLLAPGGGFEYRRGEC
jgi:hypothetical protein